MRNLVVLFILCLAKTSYTCKMNDLAQRSIRSLARTSFTLIMLGVAGGMALLLGVMGIYGVIAYSVSQRTREIGIRIALGAQSPMVTGMFVRLGMLLTASACWMDTIHRAHIYTGGVLSSNTGFGDDVGHRSPPWMDRISV